VTSGKVKDAKAFDSKAAVEKYIRKLDITATFSMLGVFMSNLKMGKERYAYFKPLFLAPSLNTNV
jgi:hypothetical protein